MNAGLLTFHRADNIGALLQAYAIQTAVLKCGVECEFIDLPQTEKTEYTDFIISNMKHADFFVRKIEYHHKLRKELFNAFRTQYLNISRPYSTYDELEDNYDKYIVGSDQVWNYAIPDTDDRYFLPFADCSKKYSYAASFGGNDIPKKKMTFVAENLSTFRRISVREQSGKDIVKQLTGRDCDLCVDPTFLLTVDEWNKLTYQINERFVFVYMVQYSDELVTCAKAYASMRGLDVKIMSPTFNFKLGFEAWSKYCVTDFLSFIRYADKVFTNSFHGTALE